MARRKERIDIVFKHIVSDHNTMSKWLYPDVNAPEGEVITKTQLLRKNSWKIYKYWTENPDLRFGQMLYNLGYSDDRMYQVEALDWIKHKTNTREQELTLWGTYGLKQDELDATIAELKENKPDPEDYMSIEPRKQSYIRYASDAIDHMDLVGFRLNKTYKPISQLNTDHIKAILDESHTNSERYIRLFKEELEFREQEGNHVSDSV